VVVVVITITSRIYFNVIVQIKTSKIPVQQIRAC
jgi:hypothetical protein